VEGKKLGITLLLAGAAVLLALSVGVAVGWRRGVKVGGAAALGLLVAGVVGYVVVFSLSLPR
jgi:hypothetical protein